MDNQKQRDHYNKMMSSRRPTKGMSCGFDSRFNPFLLDNRQELVKEFEDLFSYAFPEKPKLMLDIGCGSGLYFPALADKAEKIIGIDISEEMIFASRQLIENKKWDNIETQVGEAESLPFPDNSVDAILAFDVLHHLPDIKKVMAEISRVLRKGGRFVSIEPNVLNPIVWLAHAIPKEERGALRYNFPWVIKKLMSSYLGQPKSRYVNHVTGVNSRAVLAGIKLLNFFTRFRLFRCFSIRMVWIAEKL